MRGEVYAFRGYRRNSNPALPTMMRRFYAALGANATAQALTAVTQLCSVPVFLHIWSLEEYGQWLVLTAIPTYFALADFGFLAVIINKMTMVAASDDTERQNVLFQTACKLCLYAGFIAIIVAVSAAVLIQGAPLDSISHKSALVLLVLCAMLSLSSGLIDAAFRSSGEFALGTHLINASRFIEWIGMIIGLTWGATFISTAVGQLIGRSVSCLIGWAFTRIRHPQLHWGIAKASSKELSELARPALSFMAFPVANAINIQGTTLIVGNLFGAAFLALFSTYRTATRLIVQLITTISRSFWPEISRRFGTGDLALVMWMYRRGTYASVSLALGVCVFLYFCGEFLLGLWTSSRLPFEPSMFHLFLITATLTSFWQMGMVILSATNRHAGFSASYLVGALASVLVPTFMSGVIGRYAAVAGLIAFEVYIILMCRLHLRSFWRNVLEVA